MLENDIQRVRRFNRTFSRRIGALNDSYQDLGRPLGEARMIYEIGLNGAAVGTLRARLGLDSGYASRLLRALEKQGLVETRADLADKRARLAGLTAKGRKVYADIDRAGDAVAAQLLAPLRPEERERLIDAMQTVETLTRAVSAEIAPEPVQSEDAQWCLMQYFADIATRFDTGFDPDKGLPAGNEDLTPPRGYFLIARIDGAPVGCGALMIEEDQIGHIRRMWISPEARGLGLGRRMLAAIEDQARAIGLTAVRLETNRSLKEAQALYVSAGYTEVPAFSDEPYAHHWYEKTGLPDQSGIG
jgi:DNA-binding MarR family transcriptional regulator/GNAT superfamily N-acetyltransferase